MNTRTMKKVIATILAFILAFAHVALLGSEVYAEVNLEEQTKTINKAKIEFDAYFQNEKQEITHYKNLNVEEEEQNLYLSVKVEEGYLSSANVKIDNANFKVKETDEELEMVQSISSEENKINLNQIRKDESVILKLPIEINTGSSFDIGDLSKQASITLEGTYVNNKGKDVKVKKTINVETTIDGTAEGELKTEVTKYVPFNVNNSKGVLLQTSIKSKLVENKLPVKTTKLEIEIPSLNNVSPEKIILASKGTMATNGLGEKTFSEEEYKIEDGKIILEIQNNEEKISWNKNVEDEILLTCVYGENGVIDKTDLALNAKSEITYYSKELKTAKQEIKTNVELTEKIGDLVEAKLLVSSESLPKGYMLAVNRKKHRICD